MVAKANWKSSAQTLGLGRWLFVALLYLITLLLPNVGQADFRQPSEPYVLIGPVVVSVPALGQTEKVFTFTTPKGTLGPFTINVQNGVGTTTPPVTEGTIWLDGMQVAGPNDFRAGVSGFTRNVNAGQGTHTLKVVLRGRADSGIRLTLSGRKLLSVPVSATPSPLDLIVNATANLDVTLYPAADKDGKLLIELKNGFVTAPKQVSFVAGQVHVMVPVTGLKIGAEILSAKYRGRTVEVPVNVLPPDAKVASLTPLFATLEAGGHATVAVSLQSALPGAVYVGLASSPAGLVSHPATVLVPAGALQATFKLQGLAVGSGQLTASLNGTQATSQFVLLNQTVGVASLLPATSQIAANASENLTLSLTETVNVNTAVAISAQPAGIVSVPTNVTVPAGASQTQVLVQGQAPGTATVRAQLNGSATEAAVQVTSPPVEIAELLPPSLELVNGAQGTFTLKLNGAQPEAVEVTLATTPGAIVSVPASVTIPAGTLQTTFQVQALAVGQAQLTATLNGKSKQVTINVIPQPLALVSLLPSGLDLQPGAAGSLTLTANAAQLAGSVISLTANPIGIVQMPASITLPAGQTTVTVPVTGQAEGQTTVTANYNGSTVSALVKVSPPPPVVSAIAPTSTSTPKGRPVSLTVKLDRVPTQPQSVALASSNSAVASVPASVTVSAGSSEAVFAVMAAQTGVAQIAASLNGGSASASVTVTPAEVVTIALSPIDHTAYIGDRVPFTAQGTYTDATTRDITAETLWSSSNQTVAGIDAGGHADAAAVGNTQIGAVKDSASQQTGLSVLTPPALSLSASKTSIKEGESLSVTVTSAVAAGDLGLTITLSGGGTGGLQYPISLTLPASQSSATFTITGQSAGAYSLIASAPRRTSASLDFTITSTLTITSLVPASAKPAVS